MYWLKVGFFLSVTLGFGIAIFATDSTLGGILWRLVSDGGLQMCTSCFFGASIARFADAGSTCIALGKPGLIEGAPGLGPTPSRLGLYRLALRQSIVLAVATVAIGPFYPVVAVLVLLAISTVSGMAAVNNQILYWLAPTPPNDFRPSDPPSGIFERLLWPCGRWREWERALHDSHVESVRSYSFKAGAIQILATLLPPTIVAALAAGTVAGVPWLTLPGLKEWVVLPALIWACYLSIAGLMPDRLVDPRSPLANKENIDWSSCPLVEFKLDRTVDQADVFYQRLAAIPVLRMPVDPSEQQKVRDRIKAIGPKPNPFLRGTWISPNYVVNLFDETGLSITELAKVFGKDPDVIRRLLIFARRRSYTGRFRSRCLPWK